MTAILPMLAAFPLADTDNASTIVFLDLLARHEEAENKEQRMKVHLVAARKVDADGVVTHSQDAADDAALLDCLGDLTAWRADAEVARAMIAWLDAALTTIQAIPTEDLGAFNRASGLWSRLRHGSDATVRPLPPGAPWNAWGWPVSLAWHQTEAYGRHINPCRQKYRLLAKPGRAAVREEFAISSDLDILHKVYPVAERDALDERANVLGVSLYYSLIGPGSKRFKRSA